MMMMMMMLVETRRGSAEIDKTQFYQALADSMQPRMLPDS